MRHWTLFCAFFLAIILPACCVHSGHKPRASGNTRLPEVLEAETVALVRWMRQDGTDGDGDPIMVEADPSEELNAELKAYCSGVWVSSDTVLTAQHCIADIGRPSPIETLLRMLEGLPPVSWDPTGQHLLVSAFGGVQDKGNVRLRTAHDAIVAASDADHDLALVTIVPEEHELIADHPVSTLAHLGSVHVGDDVHVVGHPVGMWWSYTHGWVAQLRAGQKTPSEKLVDCIQVSAPVWFGNSGGGAFNDDGELIGIASFIRKVPNTAFYVGTEEVRQFLVRNKLAH